MSSGAFGPVNTSLKAAGDTPGVVGQIALSYQVSGTPGTEAAKDRADLTAGTLTNLKSSGVGSHADHSA